MTQYRRLCEGLNDSGTFIPSDANVYDYLSTDKDYYLSVFKYNEAHKETFSKTNTIAGITDVVTDKLVWDFDSKTNLEEARQNTITLVNRLMEFTVDTKDIAITFSGYKGFGIEVNLTQDITPELLKNIAFSLAIGCETFDEVIYNPARILRVPTTRHQVSKLFKTPLTFSQLTTLTCDEIRALATNQPEFNEEFRWSSITLPASIVPKELPAAPKAVVLPVANDIDFSHKIKGWTNCKWAMSQGYHIQEGDRHSKLLCLISTAKALNYSKEQAYYTAKNADEQGVSRYGGEKSDKKDVWQKVESVYGDKWLGGVFSCRDGKTPWLSDLCKTLGSHRCKKDEETVFMKSPDLFDTFYKFVINIDKNTIKTGIKELDSRVMLTTSSLNGLLGQPGSGKTSIALGILNTCNMNKIPSIFYSMDMGVPLIYLKLAQKHWGIPHDQIFEQVKRDPNRAKELRDLVEKEYPGTEWCFKTGLNVEEIRETIVHHNETRPERAKVVIIDYLECIAGPYADATANTAVIANKLKDIAIDTETCIILLLQTQKHTAAVDEPLLSMRNIKGASVIEQACSVIVTLWREGYNPAYSQMDKFISMATVKDRFNALWKYDFRWDGLRGLVTDMTDEEQDQLEKLRAQKIIDKASKASKDGGLNF